MAMFAHGTTAPVAVLESNVQKYGSILPPGATDFRYEYQPPNTDEVTIGYIDANGERQTFSVRESVLTPLIQGGVGNKKGSIVPANLPSVPDSLKKNAADQLKSQNLDDAEKLEVESTFGVDVGGQLTSAFTRGHTGSINYVKRGNQWYKAGTNIPVSEAEATRGTTVQSDSATIKRLNKTQKEQGTLQESTLDDTTRVPNASSIPDLLEELKGSDIFKELPEDQQDLVSQVYQVIAENDTDNAERLASAFETAAKISDPFFKQQIKIAKDAIERGFVSLDQEAEFEEKQINNRLKDLREDVEERKEFLGLEEQAALRGIERQYVQEQKQVRQAAAATGFTSSSRRAETEKLLDETTGDLRESRRRSFGLQQSAADKSLLRGERDIQSEVERLTELTKNNKLNLFRSAEEQLGTKNLPSLAGRPNADPLGDIVGQIPQAQTRDIISGAQNLIF